MKCHLFALLILTLIGFSYTTVHLRISDKSERLSYHFTEDGLVVAGYETETSYYQGSKRFFLVGERTTIVKETIKPVNIENSPVIPYIQWIEGSDVPTQEGVYKIELDRSKKTPLIKFKYLIHAEEDQKFYKIERTFLLTRISKFQLMTYFVLKFREEFKSIIDNRLSFQIFLELKDNWVSRDSPNHQTIIPLVRHQLFINGDNTQFKVFKKDIHKIPLLKALGEGRDIPSQEYYIKYTIAHEMHLNDIVIISNADNDIHAAKGVYTIILKFKVGEKIYTYAIWEELLNSFIEYLRALRQKYLPVTYPPIANAQNFKNEYLVEECESQINGIQKVGNKVDSGQDFEMVSLVDNERKLKRRK
jgi:hypothetical protein